MTDAELATQVIFTEWAAKTPRQRARGYWVMTPDMRDWLKALFKIPDPPPEPPRCWPVDDVTWEPGPSYPDMLLGREIRLRDGVVGIHMETDAPEPIKWPPNDDIRNGWEEA